MHGGWIGTERMGFVLGCFADLGRLGRQRILGPKAQGASVGWCRGWLPVGVKNIHNGLPLCAAPCRVAEQGKAAQNPRYQVYIIASGDSSNCPHRMYFCLGAHLSAE